MEKYRKETILFVDDEESILDIAQEYFQQKGYRVVTAENGIEALKVLESERIDCCFTDINMPGMDGLELAEHIRKADNTIPVIVMTGYPSLDNTIRTLKNGVVDFLIKPVNLNQMELCVRRVLRERQLFVENLLLKKEVEGKERIERLNQDLLILNKIMSEFASISASSDVFRQMVDMALEVVNADESKFYIINDSHPFEVSSAALSRGQPQVAALNLEKSENQPTNGIQQLVIETATDKLPLLITENISQCKLPADTISFMAVPLKIREKTFGVLTAALSNGVRIFSEKDLYYLSFISQKAAYAIENLALYENIYENLIDVLSAFVKVLEAKDPYTEQHSTRVTKLAIAIGKRMQCSMEELDILKVAGRLHDIGKIGIRDSILLKPGKLTPEEFDVIKRHPVIGAEIVGQLGLWDREREIIRHHHERFDGSGYPDGLKGKNIPILARILSVADAFDAMASDRTYRERLDGKSIIKRISQCTGTQFDPNVVRAFWQIYKEKKQVHRIYH